MDHLRSNGSHALSYRLGDGGRPLCCRPGQRRAGPSTGGRAGVSRIVRPSRRARSWRTSSMDGPDIRARIGGASRRRSFRPGMTKPIHGIHAPRPKR
jgi:hypothetical protein